MLNNKFQKLTLEEINPILDIDSAEKLQNFYISKQDKEDYGIIYTPFSLIKKMFDLLPEEVFYNPDYRWLDMGAGTGYFSIYLYHKLFISLKNIIKDSEKRKKHIIKNMLYMAEIKEEHIENLLTIFGNDTNIVSKNFLYLSKSKLTLTSNITPIEQYNIIIGNPPYNCNGKIKTPTNLKIDKSGDGITIWPDFIKKAIELLPSSGLLLTIIPAIWLKPDKAGIHKLLIGNPNQINSRIKLLKLHTLSANETNKIFNYQAQTPTTYFLCEILSQSLHNKNSVLTNITNTIDIYDNNLKEYIEYPIYRENISIPLSSLSIIKKLLPYINNIGNIEVYKSNMPPSKSKFALSKSQNYTYKNIKTCIFKKKQSKEEISSPEIIYEYSNIPQSFSNLDKPKLVLAHKMFGFAFLDKTGELGISYRDNYIITNKSLQELEIIKKFLSTKLVLAIYDATRYRMRYLEKYAFELIPDITKINKFPIDINDKNIADFFNFSNEEREIINKYPNYIYF